MSSLTVIVNTTSAPEANEFTVDAAFMSNFNVFDLIIDIERSDINIKINLIFYYFFVTRTFKL